MTWYGEGIIGQRCISCCLGGPRSIYIANNCICFGTFGTWRRYVAMPSVANNHKGGRKYVSRQVGYTKAN